MLYDAHNHLQDTRLSPSRSAWIGELERLKICGAVVNGTQESDWPAVAELAAARPWVRPAFGLHPWKIGARSPQWRGKLCRSVDATAGGSIGEIGLDRWIEGHDLQDQQDVFAAQLQIAAERDLPVSVHCIQAWGALWEIIRSHALPARGFLLHAYGGPAEMVPGFVQHGAYFSFSPDFLHSRKAAQREVFRHLPADRLLVETDAPDLRPPAEANPHPLEDEAGQPINHPANITVAYAELSRLRNWSEERLQAVIAANFQRLFGR